jgi:hypothetical protein
VNTELKINELQSLTRKGTSIEFFSAHQDHDYERMVSLCTPTADVRFTPLGEGGMGKVAELGKALWSGLIDAFPDIDNTIHSFVENDGDIACNVSIFGTQKKDFAGIPTQGLKFKNDHIFVFRFNETDKITSIIISWDHDSFSKQLGA